MKLKRWHVFFIAGMAFLLSYYLLNTKYDRFARIEGIDNDRRALIENYLSEEEQEYLILKAIPMESFEKYMRDDAFYLPHYLYYRQYDALYPDEELSLMIAKANQVADRLEKIDENDAYRYFLRLIDVDLLSDFEKNMDFKYTYLPYYQVSKNAYTSDRYVSDVNEFVDTLASIGITGMRQVTQILKDGLAIYSPEAFKVLLSGSPYYEDAQRLYTFDDLVVLNEKTYIGSYTPDQLVLMKEIHRLYFHMYLREDAYEALKNMEKAVYDDLGVHKMIVLQAYQGYGQLLKNGEYAGHDEFQLGTSISLKEDGIDPNLLQDSDVGRWLSEHAHEYGYILRYPSDKEAITGHPGIAHIYRYVGVEQATYMYENHLCLEEVGQ